MRSIYAYSRCRVQQQSRRRRGIVEVDSANVEVVELIRQGCFDDLRRQLEERARFEEVSPRESDAEREIARLNHSVSQLREDREIIAARMARERNDDRYEAIASLIA